MQLPARSLLQLSLELSQTAYNLRIAPWLDEGWTDAAIVVDEDIVCGLHADTPDARKAAVQSAARMCAKLTRRAGVGLYLDARRQKAPPAVCKALMMCRALKDGRMLIALSFAGTVRLLADWLCNLHVEENAGFHAGFLSLAQQFEQLCPRILLPRTAAMLGRKTLTLQDVLNSISQPDSPFLLLITGHSQGAALMQIFMHRLLQGGASPRRMLGIGFASPRVAFSRALHHTDYPIFHIINADDVVTRVGGVMHLGNCRVFPADHAFRALHYGKNAADLPAALLLQRTINCTADALTFAIALLQSLCALPPAEASAALSMLIPSPIAQRLKGYAQSLSRSAVRHLYARHERAFGEVNEQTLARYTRMLNHLYQCHGVQRAVQLLLCAFLQPHTLREGRASCTYAAIIAHHTQDLLPALWCEMQHPAWCARIKPAPHRVQFDRFHPFTSMRRT